MSTRRAASSCSTRGSRAAVWPAVGMLLCALSSWPTPAAGQSPFSLVNFGQNVSITEARMDGRGGWGLAERDTVIPAVKNVAGSAGLRQVAILLSGYGEAITSAGVEGERRNRRVMTPNLRAILPLLGGRGTLSAGFRALRATQYEVRVPRTWISDPDTVSGLEQLSREGTQWEIPLGLSLALSDRAAVGANLKLRRGVIRERLNEFFDLPTDAGGASLYRTSALILEDKLSGTAVTFGAVAAPVAAFSLGVQYTPAADLEVARSLELVGVAVLPDTSFTLRMPAEWGVGAAWRFAPRWRCGADYETILYSEFRGRTDWASQMRDEWTVACGVERDPARVRDAGLRNWPLRVGAMIRRWGYDVGGAEIRETRLALGTGFPFRDGNGRLDVALSHGWVGDRESNGYHDRVWRLTVSIAGLEKWW